MAARLHVPAAGSTSSPAAVTRRCSVGAPRRAGATSGAGSGSTTTRPWCSPSGARSGRRGTTPWSTRRRASSNAGPDLTVLVAGRPGVQSDASARSGSTRAGLDGERARARVPRRRRRSDLRRGRVRVPVPLGRARQHAARGDGARDPDRRQRSPGRARGPDARAGAPGRALRPGGARRRHRRVPPVARRDAAPRRGRAATLPRGRSPWRRRRAACYDFYCRGARPTVAAA